MTVPNRYGLATIVATAALTVLPAHASHAAASEQLAADSTDNEVMMLGGLVDFLSCGDRSLLPWCW